MGPTFLFVALRRREDVDRAHFDAQRLQRAAPQLGAVQMFLFAPLPESDGEHGDTYAVYARMFAEAFGVVEDPATGSATCALPAYMIRHGLLPREDGLRMVSEQGTKMGCRSLLHVLLHVAGDTLTIEVGGSVVPTAQATMELPS